MLSAFVVLVLAIDDPTPPIPPKHPDEPVIDVPKGKELGHGNAKDAAAKEAAAKAAADKAAADKAASEKSGSARAGSSKAGDKAAADKADSDKAASEKAANNKASAAVDPLKGAHGNPEQHGTPDAKPQERHASAGAADGGVEPRAEVAPPPSITTNALCEELRKSAVAKKAAQAKLEEERKALAAERAKLEETAAEIGRAREQLKEETLRLEALIEESKGVRPAPGGYGAAPRAPSGPVVGTNVVSLAKTMKAMKPAQAAQLVSRMEPRLAAQVLQQMSPKDSGAVLANVKADVAADLVASIAALPPVAEPKKKK
ncbi:MAG: hypothetical protein JNJ54_07235 [Myxococcaceae bacterium]|nr:hypothetical protein [Myxococcaceae bacterium]